MFRKSVLRIDFVHLGMLHRKQIDIAPQGFSVSKGRASVVDFLPGIAPNYVQLYIRNPAALHNWVAYLEPLKSPCWLAIVSFLLIAPLLVAGIAFCGNYLIKKLKVDDILII